MAFSGRVRRPGAFSAVAPKSPDKKSPEEIFGGEWIDDDGTVLLVRGSQIFGPGGGAVTLNIKSETACSFDMAGETYDGALVDERLTWSDGCVWIRKPSTADAEAETQKEAPHNNP